MESELLGDSAESSFLINVNVSTLIEPWRAVTFHLALAGSNTMLWMSDRANIARGHLTILWSVWAQV